MGEQNETMFSDECVRLNSALDWLIYKNVASSRKELAQLIGFSESMLSQMANDKQPISDRFLNRLSQAAPMVNIQWIISGEGKMVNDLPSLDTDKDLLEAVKSQQDLIREANRVLGSLVEKGLDDAISRQQDFISQSRADLSSLISHMNNANGYVLYSSINSHNNNTYYGTKRGRRPNSGRNADDEFEE